MGLRVGLIKTRPDVQLRGPSVLSVGQPTTLRVDVHCPEALDVAEITLEIVGAMVPQTSSSAGNNTVGRVQLARYVATLVDGPLTLRKGDHEFSATVTIADGMPGTYDGQSMAVDWTAKVHVDIPWWPDRRAFFSLRVAGRGATTLAPAQVFVSDTRGPRGRGPYAEVSLASTTVEPGKELLGRIALANVAHNRYRAIRFRLAAKVNRPTHTGVDDRARWRMALDEPVENQAIPFRLPLPTGITPGFAQGRVAMQWQLELELDVAWGRNPILWIPLEVLGRPEEVGAPVQASPLAVGSERLALVWQRAARLSGFDYADERLAILVDGRRLVIRREHRGRRGFGLVAEAALRRVDLGLRITKGKLRCRDDAQSALLAAATDPLLKRCPLNDVDEQSLRWSADDSGTRVEPVAELAQTALAFVRAFVEARERMEPPAALAVYGDQFVRAARRLGARLLRASMDIEGVRDEVPFSLQPRWDADDKLSCVVLSVRPAIPIDARYHGLFREGDGPESMPPGLQDALQGADGLAIDAETIEVIRPPTLDDVAVYAERLEALIAVALSLSMRGPGYR